MIELHYVRTPNGLKIAIMLEETGLPYRLVAYDIFAGDHLKPAFKRINPNHKLPAIVDLAPEDEGAPYPVFESGAILLYLARKSGRLLPADFRRHFLALQWLTWQVAGLGPMLGQAAHFVRYAPEGQDYGVARYTREARRLLNVLDARLGEAPYLAEEYSIADIACWPWVQNIGNYDMSLAEFPAIRRWSEAIAARPAVAAAVGSPATGVPTAYLKRRMTLTPEQWSNMFGDNLLRATERGGG
ncbi:MAG: glutathione S-transferase N-terminal domain-containing protein [Candidatus Odyssella sp.]|nr:glutathione S-transferase N-terminal domain-containing protein [Candidatus Odyssella sp.]